MQAGDDGVVEVALGQSGVLQRRREGLTGQRDVELLAEAFLPDVRVGLARHAPAVEELVTGRAAPDQLGHAPSGAQRKAAAPSPLSRSSAEPASPVRRSDTTARVVRPARRRARRRSACSSVATAERDDPAKS